MALFWSDELDVKLMAKDSHFITVELLQGSLGPGGLQGFMGGRIVVTSIVGLEGLIEEKIG